MEENKFGKYQMFYPSRSQLGKNYEPVTVGTALIGWVRAYRHKKSGRIIIDGPDCEFCAHRIGVTPEEFMAMLFERRH